MKEEKISFEYGARPRVLLCGNGFNRAFGADNWDELLEKFRVEGVSEETVSRVKKMPYPLQPVVLSRDHVDIKMKSISPRLTEACPPEEEAELLRRLGALPFDAILTTNYSYELEKSFHPDFKCRVGRACSIRHTVCSGEGRDTERTMCTYFEGTREDQSIWHIHGEAARYDTMVMGHYYYGKLLARMQRGAAKLQSRYKGNSARGQGMDCRGWLDYFMLGDVYIIAQGLNLSEMDLWWLINCKKRNFPDTKMYLFKPHAEPEIVLLAEAYGLEIISDEEFSGGYVEYYSKLIDKLSGEFRL